MRELKSLIVFVLILILLNGLFALGGVHEHISIVGSVVLTLVVSGIMTLVVKKQRC